MPVPRRLRGLAPTLAPICIALATLLGCAGSAPSFAPPRVALPSGLPLLGAPCTGDHTEPRRPEPQTWSWCGRDGRVSVVALLDFDRVHGARRRCPPDWPSCIDDTPPASPTEVIAPIEYPKVVLAELAGEDYSCGPVPEGRVVFSDGSNLWIRSVRAQDSTGVLLIADRARLTEANADRIRELLDLPEGVALDDASLRSALDKIVLPVSYANRHYTAVERARMIKTFCARRAAEQMQHEEHPK